MRCVRVCVCVCARPCMNPASRLQACLPKELLYLIAGQAVGDLAGLSDGAVPMDGASSFLLLFDILFFIESGTTGTPEQRGNSPENQRTHLFNAPLVIQLSSPRF